VGPGKWVEDVEFATLEWVAWHNTSRRLGYVSSNEFERASYDRRTAAAGLAALTLRALRRTRSGSDNSSLAY
jgi:hypothetical protein